MSDLKYFQSSLFSSLQHVIINDGSEDVTYRFRDVEFIISQKKLEALDPSELSKYLEPLNHSPSSENLSISDSDLISLVQSRYIQQPSDVQNFANFLKEAANNISSNFKDFTERQQRWNEFKEFLSKKYDNNSSSSDLHDNSNTIVSHS